jgi:hypothetical protein
MRRPIQGGDTNHDGLLDKTELIAAVQRQSEPEQAAGSTVSIDRNADSPTEHSLGSRRRPVNMAYNQDDSIFGGKDLNNDRQLQMSEYASDWDVKTAEEFRQRDLNSDGVITEMEWRGER